MLVGLRSSASAGNVRCNSVKSRPSMTVGSDSSASPAQARGPARLLRSATQEMTGTPDDLDFNERVIVSSRMVDCGGVIIGAPLTYYNFASYPIVRTNSHG